LFTARRSHAPDSAVEDHQAVADPDERILNRVFVVGFSVQALSTQAQYALLLLTPIVLNARGWEAGPIGPITIIPIVRADSTIPIGGRAGDDRGRRRPATIGLAIASTGVAVLLLAGSSIAPVLLVAGLAVFGVGLGLTTPNLMSAALGSVPAARAGAAAGVLSMSRYVGSIGTSLLIAGFVTADADGTRVVLGVSAICMTLALLVSRGLPDAQPKSASDPDETAERSH
jgi:DHA2 family methylenomycin A resistance protein-like MFS transporter